MSVPPWLQGRSLLPLAQGEVDHLHDEVFSELTYHAAHPKLRRALGGGGWLAARYRRDTEEVHHDDGGPKTCASRPSVAGDAARPDRAAQVQGTITRAVR
jgi:hypothetical protein